MSDAQGDRHLGCFGPGADADAHDAVGGSAGDTLIAPSADEVRRATAIVDGFEAARARGEDRVLVEGLWVEVPTCRNARRLVERARRLIAKP